MRVLIVDNFDSFTHNLAQLLGGLGAHVLVRRNDCALTDLLRLGASRIVLSPGPGGPLDAGVSAAVLRAVEPDVRVLGVCLGMQVMAVALGGRVARAPRPIHGGATAIEHDGAGVFAGVPSPFLAGRYHSLTVQAEGLPSCLEACAWSEGVLMGLRHRARPLHAVQFHPESVLTPHGLRLLANFLGE